MDTDARHHEAERGVEEEVPERIDRTSVSALSWFIEISGTASEDVVEDPMTA
jgi:hypothetical protein